MALRQKILSVLLVLAFLAAAITAAPPPNRTITTAAAAEHGGVNGGRTNTRTIPPLPLSTKSRWIVDAEGYRVKLVCVNWSGAHMKDYVVGGLHVATMEQIARQIRDNGFNCVRLQWSLELYWNNPIVGAEAVRAMPELVGAKALDVYELTVNTLAQEGVFVVLDNHMSDANWCCNIDDGNGLWYTNRWPEEYFFEGWKGMVARFVNQPMVIAVDLRNELRPTFVDRSFRDPRWGSGDLKNDWYLAASRAANDILAINPKLLVVVQGTHSGKLLIRAKELPIQLSVPNKLVYSSHDYKWFHLGINFNQETEETYQEYRDKLDRNWGFILEDGNTYTAPMWVGEFGTGHNDEGLNYYWKCLLRYMKERDLDFSYWPIDGTQSRGDGREFGAEEGFGILNTTWSGIAYQPHFQSIQDIMAPYLGPIRP